MAIDGGLTPIKVPGKRKRHSDEVRPKLGRNRRPFNVLSGRPPKEKSVSVSTAPTEPHKKHRCLMKLKSKRRMATLETLPIEILENIFILSLCFALPNSSPTISGKLSSHRTYLKSIKVIFHPTWDHDYRCIKDESLPSGRDPLYPSVTVPGNHVLQSALLRCRWATLDILREAEAEWLREAWSKKEEYPLVSFPTTPQHKSSKWHRELEDDIFDADYESFKELKRNGISSLIPSAYTYNSPRKLLRDCTSGFLLVHPLTEIPDTILRGPWTDQMTKNLFWLIRAGAEIRWTDSTKGEIALDGLREAVKTGRDDVLALLQHGNAGHGVTSELVLWTVGNATGNFKEILHYVAGMYLHSNPILQRGRPGVTSVDESLVPWVRSTLGPLDEASKLMIENGDVRGAKALVSTWMKTFDNVRLERDYSPRPGSLMGEPRRRNT